MILSVARGDTCEVARAIHDDGNMVAYQPYAQDSRVKLWRALRCYELPLPEDKVGEKTTYWPCNKAPTPMPPRPHKEAESDSHDIHSEMPYFCDRACTEYLR